MRIDIATLFPDMCEAVLGESIIGRARKAGKIELHCHQIRDYTLDKHNRVDDSPYGGGMGMVMQAEPIYRCFNIVTEGFTERPHVIYMSPKGSVFTQQKAVELSKRENIFVICGHYEGVDQRLLDKIVDEEISIGDYVLTGGELPAMVMMDSISRMVPGVLSNQESGETESFAGNLLEYPQYSRPEEWHGKKVPEVLMSGHHANIEKWRREQSIIRTARRRPDLLKKADLTNKEWNFVRQLKKQWKEEESKDENI